MEANAQVMRLRRLFMCIPIRCWGIVRGWPLPRLRTRIELHAPYRAWEAFRPAMHQPICQSSGNRTAAPAHAVAQPHTINAATLCIHWPESKFRKYMNFRIQGCFQFSIQIHSSLQEAPRSHLETVYVGQPLLVFRGSALNLVQILRGLLVVEIELTHLPAGPVCVGREM